MPCVRGQFNDSRILLKVGFFNPDNAQRTEKQVSAQCYEVMALVDTGATHSCITSKVAQQIDLYPDGKTEVGGVHGRKAVNTYTPSIVIAEIGLVQERLQVTEVVFSNTDICQAIIGMDILQTGVFQLDFSGNFIFCR